MEGKFMEYKKMLVAYDGSETSKKALAKAKEIAQDNEQMEILVTTVWEIPTRVYEDYMYEDITERYLKRAEKDINEAKQLLKDVTNEKHFSVLEGHRATTILEYAKRKEVDVIVIGNRGLGAVKRLFLGSVSFHVVQKAECDVLVVKDS